VEVHDLTYSQRTISESVIAFIANSKSSPFKGKLSLASTEVARVLLATAPRGAISVLLHTIMDKARFSMKKAKGKILAFSMRNLAAAGVGTSFDEALRTGLIRCALN